VRQPGVIRHFETERQPHGRHPVAYLDGLEAHVREKWLRGIHQPLHIRHIHAYDLLASDQSPLESIANALPSKARCDWRR
jgi:hypothetical protein